MKKIVLFFVLFAVSVFAQSWNSIHTTTINVSNIKAIENYANKDGIHVLLQTFGDDIKYYRINSSGSVADSSTLSYDGEFPNIVGDESMIYAVYKEGANIRIRKSSNGGANWSTEYSRQINNSNSSGMDAALNNSGVNVAWTTYDNYYQVHYIKFKTSNYNWEDYQNVSNGYGTFPSITISPSRIHVGYNSGFYSDPGGNTGDAKCRTKYNNSWQNSETIVGNSGSMIEKVFATDSRLWDFHYKIVAGIGQYHSDLYASYRSVSGSTWSSPVLIDTWADVYQLANVAETDGGDLHLFYSNGELKQKIYNGSSWSSTATVVSDNNTYQFAVNGAGDDMYAVFYESGSNYLKYRQYDDNPLTPQSFNGQNYNNRPKLTWAYNKEPDIQHYEIWRQLRLLGQAPGDWTLLTTTTSNSYIDNGVTLGSAYIGSVKYKIRAKDNSGHLSGYTSEKSFLISGVNKIVYTEDESITEFTLKQNYPNPFNPETAIEYSLPSQSVVKLSVYNMIGERVTELVNGVQEAGVYKVYWNGVGLASGVYVYRIEAQSGDKTFVQNKRMILMK